MRISIYWVGGFKLKCEGTFTSGTNWCARISASRTKPSPYQQLHPDGNFRPRRHPQTLTNSPDLQTSLPLPQRMIRWAVVPKCISGGQLRNVPSVSSFSSTPEDHSYSSRGWLPFGFHLKLCKTGTPGTPHHGSPPNPNQ